MKETLQAITPFDLLRASKILHIAVENKILPDFAYDIRAHKECEFFIVQSGSCSIYLGGTTIECTEGDYLLILPYVCHSFIGTSLEPCCLFNIHFNLDYLNNPLYQSSSIHKIDLYHYFFTYVNHFLTGKSDFQLDYCTHNIMHEYQTSSGTSFSMLNYYLFELMLLLTKKIQAEFPVDTDFRNPYVKQTIDYIGLHYQERLTLPEIASYLQITSRYLSKLFYDNTHSTVLDYINSYRVNQSVLLMQQGLSFTRIAFQVGFSSPPHYAKVFKKYMGVSPKEYRNSILSTS